MIKLFSLDQYCNNLPLITSPNFFVGNSRDQYDPNGLFSEKLFGPKNSKDWATKEGKIELKTKVFNPVIFNLLKRLNRKLYDTLISDNPFKINDDGSINYNPELKSIGGINYLIENWSRIKFDDSTPIRKKLVDFIQDQNNLDKLFISTILVIPPKYRPIYIVGEKQEMMYDDLNDFYVKLIKKTQQNVSFTDNILFRSYTLSIQLTVNELYDYVKSKIGKKTGYIRGNLLGKRTDFSGRAVITGDSDLPPDTIAVPFRMIVNIYRPFIIHKILQTPLDNWADLTKNYGGNYSIKTIENVLDAIAKGYTIDDKLYKYIWRITETATKDKVVLAKRDPSLHRESWQAYKFIIWGGDTIKLTPTSVGMHNADFDGDQMAIYGLLSDEAQEEAKRKMLNIQASSGYTKSTREFSKDFILGLYVLTK